MRGRRIGFLAVLAFLAITTVMAGAQTKVTLPSDAVSAAEQVMNYPLLLENGTYVDFMKTMYNCIQGAALYAQESLMGFDKDLKVIPLGATKWSIAPGRADVDLHAAESEMVGWNTDHRGGLCLFPPAGGQGRV